MMRVTHQNKLLVDARGLPMPDVDEPGARTPDTLVRYEAMEGEDFSGHATPKRAPMAGRGLIQKLGESVAEKLRCVEEDQRKEDERLQRQITPVRLGLDIGTVPPEKPQLLRLGNLLSPPSAQRQEDVLAPPSVPAPPPGLEPPKVVSIGSIGHPFSCREACKYMKRKSGCLLGVSCPHCHLCSWRRKCSAPAPAAQAPPAPSAPGLKQDPADDGRVGVPGAGMQAGCAPAPAPQPPAPFGRASWQEPAYICPAPDAAVAPAPTQAPAPADAEQGAAAGDLGPSPSVGSIGHPFNCGRACKYAGKAHGCKVGYLCDRCHLCRWTRSKEHGYAAAGKA